MPEKFGDELRLDFNEQYQWDCDPYGQPEAFNPVHTNNKLLVIANAMITVTQRVTKNQKQLRKLRTERRSLADAVETVEREILVTAPPKAAQVRTLKMQAAYIDTQAIELKLDGKLKQARDRLLALDDQIEDVETEIKNDRMWFETMKLEGEHIKTFLSYYKDEARRAGSYV